jgi:predicted ATPase
LFHCGEFAPARLHLEQSIAFYGSQQHPPPMTNFTAIVSLSYAAGTLWRLGYPDQALKRTHEALTLAQGLFHPFLQAAALHFATVFHQCRWEVQTVREQAEALIALCTEQGFAQFLALGIIMRGWALTERGQAEEGITQMQQVLATLWAQGQRLSRPYFLALLAEAQGKARRTEEGLIMLAEALARVDNTGEREYEAELYRLKGTLTLQSKVQSLESKVEEEAEACFQKAIEIAHQQQAKSLELRATISLARLWQQQGKKNEARQLLAEIYNWFTEGFDTADLQEAKALLEALR